MLPGCSRRWRTCQIRGLAAARHVLTACDQATGVMLASTDVDGKTNEITRFQPLLDQIDNLTGAVMTADALHCQREHVAYLAQRGAHWILLTVKGNQPHLHAQLTALPWQAVPDAERTSDLHWVRDVTYDEDRSQIRTGTGPQVMAALRNAAIGALRRTGVTNIAAANRHHARDSHRPLTLLGIT